MHKLLTSNLKLGIIAGGQLAKMLIQEASKWDIDSYVLDSEPDCPAASIASHSILGSYRDYDDVYRFGKMVDLLSFEIEHVNVEALIQLKREGLRIVPDPRILELIQDKGLQKEFFARHGIPTAEFKTYGSAEAIRGGIERGEISYPFVQKLRKGGYDGRGVAVIQDAGSLDSLLHGASLVERRVEIDRELSVVVARNGKGEIKSYPVVEMLFDPKANLADMIICPSSVGSEQSEKALSLAARIIEDLKMEGVLAVEFFVDQDGEVVVNEMAPRTHNSGHHTIESVATSQFEQQLRAVLDLPLGSTQLLLPAVMVNIVGDEGHEGPVRYEGVEEILALEGVNLHLYGKKITRPYRKMGHVTVVSASLADALEKAKQVKETIGVKSWKHS